MLHQIGSGVLGPVFRTYEPQRDRLIAVKAFRLDIVPEQVARLADALRRLGASDPKHPAIVAAVDAGLEGATAYLAMDYVAAETLDVALRHLAPSPLDRALPILSQIADAIEAAWAAGLGHGALHPRDIFVTTGTNDVRVTGFGVVPALESVGIRPPVRRPYAAPERGNAEVWDIRADVYSLGAIAHELLTRRRPAGPSDQDGALVTGTTPEQRVQIRRVLAAALAERPEHRFATPTALIAALTSIVQGEPLGPLPEGGDEVAASSAPVSVANVTNVSNVAEVQAASTPDLAPAVVTTAVEALPHPPAAVRVPAPRLVPPVAVTAASPSVPTYAPSNSGTSGISETTGPGSPTAQVAPVATHAQVSPFYIPVPPKAPYPWVAVIAAIVAGVFLGGVGGYRIGLRRAPVVAPAAAVTVTPVPSVPIVRPNDTEVAVSPETTPAAPVTAPAPAAATTAAPARGAVNLPGRILVRSVPSGASIAIDGHAHGQTPATVRDLSFGAHTLVVSHPGYASHTEKVTLTAEQPARNLTVDLKPARVAHQLRIARSPEH